MNNTKSTAYVRKFSFWLIVLVAGTIITTIVGAFIEQGIENKNLLALFLSGLSWIRDLLIQLLNGLVWLFKQWVFALMLGLVLGAFLTRTMISRNKSNKTKNFNAEFAYPNSTARANLASFLRQMADWGEKGFGYSYYSYDQHSESWFVEQETNIEATIAALCECGIFVPEQFRSFSRKKQSRNAVKHYIRIARLLELDQVLKARQEYPQPEN